MLMLLYETASAGASFTARRVDGGRGQVPVFVRVLGRARACYSRPITAHTNAHLNSTGVNPPCRSALPTKHKKHGCQHTKRSRKVIPVERLLQIPNRERHKYG